MSFFQGSENGGTRGQSRNTRWSKAPIVGEASIDIIRTAGSGDINKTGQCTTYEEAEVTLVNDG